MGWGGGGVGVLRLDHAVLHVASAFAFKVSQKPKESLGEVQTRRIPVTMVTPSPALL